MRGRTDLAIEHLENITAKSESKSISGIRKKEYEKQGLKITDIEVLEDSASEILGKDKGRYITITLHDYLSNPETDKASEDVLSKVLLDLLPEDGTILVAGLGNSEITPDALGPLAAGKIFATRHIPKDIGEKTGLSDLRKVCSIPVGVLGQTGIESEETIKTIAKTVGAKAVIVIDALAAGSIRRLFNTIQITDSGISPGSGVQNKRKKISKESLDGISVIAVGVPTVTDADTIIEEGGGENTAENMVITPKDVDKLILKTAKMISSALNRALFPELSKEDIEYLVL